MSLPRRSVRMGIITSVQMEWSKVLFDLTRGLLLIIGGEFLSDRLTIQFTVFISVAAFISGWFASLLKISVVRWELTHEETSNE